MTFLEKHQDVFEEGLGTLKGFEEELQVDPTAQPKYCIFVKEELDCLVEEGTVEPIAFSEWASPIVPVLKSDKKSVRICEDFKLTVNRAAWLDQYPIPKVQDLFAELAGGQSFTKLDLSQAYQQICLSEESKKYVNQHQQGTLPLQLVAIWSIYGPSNIPMDNEILAARYPTGDCV